MAFEEAPEKGLSRLSIPRLKTTIAILQDYSEPDTFSVVDFAQSLRLCKIDRESFDVINLIDGRRSIQEIAEIAGHARTRQDSLKFFRLLNSRRMLDFQ